MREQGAAMIEALLVTAIVGLIWAAAASVVSQVPAQAARWEDASAMRQRLRVIESRIGRMAASSARIVADVGGHPVRIPGIWPRRLGATRPGAPGEVSPEAATFLTRNGPQRELVLIETLAGSSGDVAIVPRAGCGAALACGLREGDTLLVIAAGGACGLYRVEAIGARLRLDALMEQGAASFEAGSVLVPVSLEVVTFDAAEHALRRYDGYRSDNVMADEVRAVGFNWPAGMLNDGPFVGSGPLAYDVDQLSLRQVQLTIDMTGPAGGAARRASMMWRTGLWR